MALTNEQLIAFLRLPKFGMVKGFALGNHALENDMVLDNDRDMLEFLNLSRNRNLARGICEYSLNEIRNARETARRIIEQSEENGIRLVTYYDDDYPKRLRDIRSNGKAAAPLVLWYKGRLEAANLPGIAIIGTREPTSEGIKAGHYFGRAFAEAGFNIVSGLAYGCDKSGHEGALMAENGTTTAFLAHGLDTVYPPEHKDLADEILEKGGLLMSEYAIGTRGIANYFVERDRLQSGLSEACLVIQTGIQGGTLHAVRATVENRKPLYAVSYSSPELMSQEKVAGNVMLIEEGIEVGNGLAFGKAQPITSRNIDEVILLLKASFENFCKGTSAPEDNTRKDESNRNENGQYLLF